MRWKVVDRLTALYRNVHFDLLQIAKKDHRFNLGLRASSHGGVGDVVILDFQVSHLVFVCFRAGCASACGRRRPLLRDQTPGFVAWKKDCPHLVQVSISNCSTYFLNRLPPVHTTPSRRPTQKTKHLAFGVTSSSQTQRRDHERAQVGSPQGFWVETTCCTFARAASTRK